MIQVLQLQKQKTLPKDSVKLAGQHLTSLIAEDRIPEFESLPDETILSFQYLNVKETGRQPERLVISLRDHDLIFLCQSQETHDDLLSMMKSGRYPSIANEKTADPDKVLQLFFSELIRKDFEHLEALEDRITETENDLLLTGGDEKATSKIIEYRKEIRRIKRYAESLARILQGLYENENNLMTEELQKHFKILDDKMDWVLMEVQNLHEYVSQLREAYQAQTDIQQNNLMKVFTIIAAIFMPLTLLVGWYGMNLQMPEFQWKYSYPVVAAVSVAIFIGGIFYFKKKKWL